ncbi:hypothetical protein EVAR_31489_1 [Eumeta japonica]|uniref:Uncharacterized protein n=1 Tax=Eumeta variegata TaxID=151549 RepID=A0A4C1WBV4_EUMVA|nr:hypothetical protein EVAR_31489_1 [Eumeta japonica]
MPFGFVTRNWIRRPVKSGIPFNHTYVNSSVHTAFCVRFFAGHSFLRNSGVVAAPATPRLPARNIREVSTSISPDNRRRNAQKTGCDRVHTAVQSCGTGFLLDPAKLDCPVKGA